jgi:hypothetical protein
MRTQFIFDRELKNQQDIIAQVMQLAGKKAYPSPHTTHLATFIDSCFAVIQEEEIEKQAAKKIAQKKQEWETKEKRAEEIEKQKVKELESLVPLPQAPMPVGLELPSIDDMNKPPKFELTDIPAVPKPPGMQPPSLQKMNQPAQIQQPAQFQKREYVLRIYNSPIGIFIDKVEEKPIYHVVEPAIDKQIVEKAKYIYATELERNNELFDDPKFWLKAAEKVARKTGVQFTNILPDQLRYFLERDLVGAGKFDVFLYDEKVKAIFCEGPNKPLRIDYGMLGKIETNVKIDENKEIDKLLELTAKAAGSELTDTNPILDVAFQGLKFEGIKSVGGRNSTITIRRLQ